MSWRRRLRAIASRLGLEGAYDRSKKIAGLDPRRLLRAARYRRWNRGAADDEIVLRPGLRLRIDPSSREPFEHFCFSSLEMADELDAFLRQATRFDRFLDVGACHGIFSLAFVHGRPQARALAVEPSPAAFEILAGNAARNRAANLAIAQTALGAGAGAVRMRRSWHHLEALGEREADAEAVAVCVQSMDDFCAERGFHPDVIKIDVEGFEHAVLLGARAVLERERPYLFLEVHPRRLAELGSSTSDLAALLTEHRYRFQAVSGRAMSLPGFVSRDGVFRVLCAPL
jgi:FkbM family methyltransferase